MGRAPEKWEVERQPPHPALRGHVLSCAGYAAWAATPMLRVAVPIAGVISP